eukprot:GHVR01153211.1.p2 GENE.GHVR01153211.1~~GHVR01153211.1.p2  ORF type:complete len:111 (+),score=4.93 GHVR01153211.1:2468-2800(+)
MEGIIQRQAVLATGSVNLHCLSIESEYLIALSERKFVREFSITKKCILRDIVSNFTLEDAQACQDIDCFGYNGKKAIQHDVKAAEYFLKEKIKNSSLADVLEFIHFGITS